MRPELYNAQFIQTVLKSGWEETDTSEPRTVCTNSFRAGGALGSVDGVGHPVYIMVR